MLNFLLLLKNVSINIKHFSVNFHKVSVILQTYYFRFANDIGEYDLPFYMQYEHKTKNRPNDHIVHLNNIPTTWFRKKIRGNN